VKREDVAMMPAYLRKHMGKEQRKHVYVSSK